MPDVLVAQIGARRQYAVPRSLTEAGHMCGLVTDACAHVPPWSLIANVTPRLLQVGRLRTVLDRQVPGVDPVRIRGSLSFFLATRFGTLRARRGEPRAAFWVRQNRAFGRTVRRLDWGTADTVYAFNGAALEIFEEARHRGVRRILDQTSVPWRYSTNVLGDEQARWPGWEECPSDIDSSGGMIEREEAEWELADRIICGSSFVVDSIAAVGGPVEKCRVVRYPIPIVPENLLTQWKGPRDTNRRIRILFVGTLQLRKGIQYLWEAAGRLDRRFELRAVGPSRLTSRAEALVRERIHWLGPVSRSQVWAHYFWADAFVLPTLLEGSANVCWEALAAGLPVITTRAAGIAVADEQTILLPEASGGNLAATLLRLGNGLPRKSPAPDRRSLAQYGDDLVRACA